MQCAVLIDASKLDGDPWLTVPDPQRNIDLVLTADGVCLAINLQTPAPQESDILDDIEQNPDI